MDLLIALKSQTEPPKEKKVKVKSFFELPKKVKKVKMVKS